MINRILEKYDTKVEGLNNQEVEIRQKNFGPNELKEVKKDSPLKLFLSQFTDVLIFLQFSDRIQTGISGRASHGKTKESCQHNRHCKKGK